MIFNELLKSNANTFACKIIHRNDNILEIKLVFVAMLELINVLLLTNESS